MLPPLHSQRYNPPGTSREKRNAVDTACKHRALAGLGQLLRKKPIMKCLWNSSQEHHHIFSPGLRSPIMTVSNATAEKLYLMSDHAKDYSLIVAYYSLSHTPQYPILLSGCSEVIRARLLHTSECIEMKAVFVKCFPALTQLLLIALLFLELDATSY